MTAARCRTAGALLASVLALVVAAIGGPPATAEVPDIGLVADRSEIDFGPLTRTLADSRSFEIRNTGDVPVVLDTPTTSGPFTVDPLYCNGYPDGALPPGGSLDAGGTCFVTVFFRPVTDGPASGEVVIPVQGSTDDARVALRGEGTPTGPVPTISSMSPTSGPAAGGTLVRITGTNLQAVTQVYLGSAGEDGGSPFSTTPTFRVNASGTALSFRTQRVQSRSLARVILITATSVSAVSAEPFRYIPPPLPRVSSVKPASVPESGGTVTLTGTDLSWVNGVIVDDGYLSDFQASGSDTTLRFTAPPHAPGQVPVVLNSFVGTVPLSLTYSAAPPPVVSRISPSRGPASGGTSVTLTGSGLAAPSRVSIAGTEVPFTVGSGGTTVSFLTPSHPVGRVPVVVTTAAGSSAPVTFTYR